MLNARVKRAVFLMKCIVPRCAPFRRHLLCLSPLVFTVEIRRFFLLFS